MNRRGASILTYTGAVLLLIFILAPLVWLVISSLIPEEAILSRPPNWFGYGLTTENYTYILTGRIPQSHLVSGQMRTMISQEVRLVPRAILNSFIVAVGVMLVNLIVGSLAAYAYARLRFPGRRSTFYLVTLSRLIPAVALAVPYYVIVQRAGLQDTYWALIAVYSALTLPFSALILTLYFRAVPVEIEEAAVIDGCGPFDVLWRVTLPLALPSLIGAGLFAFMLSYSEFLFALLITTSIRTRTLPVVLGSVSWNPDITWSLLSAGIVLGLVPTVLLVVPVWRFMVRGLAAGASR
jgi:multiple sugar transport system permease protein